MSGADQRDQGGHGAVDQFSDDEEQQYYLQDGVNRDPEEVDPDDDSEEEGCYEIPDEVKTPVVILLGYLGAGKTTLVNYILKEQRDLKICVIENEFGAVSIDDDLVSENVRESEDIVVMDNGCVCCTVRGDLVKTLLGFSGKQKVFDFILLETTGLADPSPIVSTFNLDQDINDFYRVDSLICVVDAKHIGQQLQRQPPPEDVGKVNEAAQQLAFADRILLNKTDLVSKEELELAKKHISQVNAFAEIIETQKSRAPIKQLLGLSSFNLERTLELLEAEAAAEAKAAEEAQQRAAAAAGHAHGHSHAAEDAGAAAGGGGGAHACGDAGCSHDHGHDHHGHGGHAHDHGHDAHGEKRKADGDGDGAAHKRAAPLGSVVATRHNTKVGSIGLTLPGSLDVALFNEFMADLMERKAADMYRCKGVLSFAGQPNKYVFQGVHEQIVCEPTPHLWPDAVQDDADDSSDDGSAAAAAAADAAGPPRHSKIVFIGYDLDKEWIEQALRRALAADDGSAADGAAAEEGGADA
ncbi:CobW/HypB/UreG, nucleotide-binding domain-containing protein [Tribonema minus]|uniref:CobW/HypB/UreG, nucleotide-binding domain-containing protein n=1 Tax=Tribonema minus TaxID=303371 RepID=A0A836CCU3_9STRA|nr:CobW/HypB/UreG, nucleotide-binding domain-containing protein [Tribonema minus]